MVERYFDTIDLRGGTDVLVPRVVRDSVVKFCHKHAAFKRKAVSLRLVELDPVLITPLLDTANGTTPCQSMI